MVVSMILEPIRKKYEKKTKIPFLLNGSYVTSYVVGVVVQFTARVEKLQRSDDQLSERLVSLGIIET